MRTLDTMKFSEPTFETGGDFWPAPSNVPDVEAHALEEKLAQKSALRLRLTEVLALYSVQQRQATELQDAYDEIEFRKPSPSTKWALPPRKVKKRACKRNSVAPFRNQKCWLIAY
jgi:hypothetical protein